MAQKAVEIVLMRQLASYLAVPIFATTAGVRRFVTFHHDPEHDDDTLGRLLDEALGTVAHPFAIVPGTEGLSLDLAAD
jgi:hypothetical protein